VRVIEYLGVVSGVHRTGSDVTVRPFSIWRALSFCSS